MAPKLGRSTSGNPQAQNAAYRVALLLAIGIGVIHDGTSRDETVTVAIGKVLTNAAEWWVTNAKAGDHGNH